MPAPKLQRWIDLLAALLRRHYAVPFEDIAADVPAYQQGEKESIRRRFERDKDELRAFGVPLETIRDGAGEVLGYRLSRRDFYLPYLSLLLDGRPTRTRTVDRDGFRALQHLAFEPDELTAIVQAGKRVESLGNPLLAEDARSAIRKLAVDLPVDAARPDDEAVAPGHPAPSPEMFDLLNEALEHQKRLTMEYRAMSSGDTSLRAVEPLGLFFLGHHWYLAARDPGDDTVKNFRVSRIARAEINRKQPGTADFGRPAGFRLREHARSRQAWELGEGDSTEVTVEFRRPTGAAATAAGVGRAVEGAPVRRQFQVRRLDAFVRWLLPLGDAARVVSPAAVRDEYDRQVAATLALYPEPA